MIGPNLILFTIFVVVPVVGGLLLSFTTWDITNGLAEVGRARELPPDVLGSARLDSPSRRP